MIMLNICEQALPRLANYCFISLGSYFACFNMLLGLKDTWRGFFPRSEVLAGLACARVEDLNKRHLAFLPRTA